MTPLVDYLALGAYMVSCWLRSTDIPARVMERVMDLVEHVTSRLS